MHTIHPHSWFALQVHTRREGMVNQALRCKAFETFLPTYTESRRYSDRVRKLESALFPGYLFCRLDPDHTLSVLTTAGVYEIVRTGTTLQAVDEAEIAAIRRVVESSCSAKPWPYLKTGDPVRVQFGSLAGVEGLLVSEKGVDRLILSVSMLQRSVSVEIDRSWIQPIRRSQTFSRACTAVYSTRNSRLSYAMIDSGKTRAVELGG